MKPVSILHVNVNSDGEDIVVIDIQLTDDDKQMIYEYHMNDEDAIDYDADDVSMLAFVYVGHSNRVDGFYYGEQAYYPADYGEHLIDNRVLPDNLEKLCIDFVRENYIGHEDEYEHR